MIGEQALNRYQIQKVNLRSRYSKEKKLRLIPLELRLTRGKNARKGQVVMNKNMNMMTGSVFMSMMTVNCTFWGD